MARLQIHMESMALRFTCQADVHIPLLTPEKQMAGVRPEDYYSSDNKLPVMFLYHGGSGDKSDWFRFTRVEQLADQYGFVIVCPSAQNSCYMNMAYGPKWSDFVNEELYDRVHAMFPVSDDPDKNFAVGLSMGGYGAFRSALKYPDRFGWGAGLSSGVHIPQETEVGTVGFPDKGLSHMGEGSPLGGPDDLFYAAEQLAKSGKKLPKLFSACGQEDFTYAGNLWFASHVKALGYDITWVSDKGSHEWDYWEEHIRQVCKWLPLSDEK